MNYVTCDIYNLQLNVKDGRRANGLSEHHSEARGGRIPPLLIQLRGDFGQATELLWASMASSF